MDPLARFEWLRRLELPKELRAALTTCSVGPLHGLIYCITPPDDLPPSLAWAKALLSTAKQVPPENLVPLMPVDDRSLACVVCGCDTQLPAGFGTVVRWHLDDVPAWAQAQQLDIGVKEYLAAVADELSSRTTGLNRTWELVDRYDKSHGSQGKTPRAVEARPIRLAVQNVIVGLANYRYDASCDALTVSAWQTCQVPHLAAHEGTRGLACLTLGEAFRCGSTMEIRFHDHPERKVPAALQQYARTQGIDLGIHDPASISPAEARLLMWAVTRMPPRLGTSLERVCNSGALRPERACYFLLSGTWSAPALDFMLSSEPRVALRVLSGGSPPTDWLKRRDELRVARRAFLVDRFIARATAPREGNDGAVQALEDDLTHQEWSVNGAAQSLTVRGDNPVPWLSPPLPLAKVVLCPRDVLESHEIEEVEAGVTNPEPRVVFVVPRDAPLPRSSPGKVLMAQAPWTLEALDREVRKRLVAMKVTRK